MTGSLALASFFIHVLVLRGREFGFGEGHWAWLRNFSSLLSEQYLLSVYECLVLAQGCQLVVVVVTVEEALNRISSEHKGILFEVFIFLVLPFLVYIFLVEVVLLRWHEGRLYLPVPKVLPGEVFEPRMRLYFSRSIYSQTVNWLSLNHFIYEISCLN